jgi:hypothetical protein
VGTVVDAIDERMADTFAEKYIERTRIDHVLDMSKIISLTLMVF